jgi:hypothetical protein
VEVDFAGSFIRAEENVVSDFHCLIYRINDLFGDAGNRGG